MGWVSILKKSLTGFESKSGEVESINKSSSGNSSAFILISLLILIIALGAYLNKHN